MKSLLISAPFGNYFNLLGFKGVTYTLGTFTARPRGWGDKPYGSKWFRVLLTVRPNPFRKSWRNKLGLKNPGIDWLVRSNLDVSDKIVSIYGFSPAEWTSVLSAAESVKPLGIELNASCPNVHKPPFDKETFAAAASCAVPHKIVKIPPVNYMPVVDMAYEAGIRMFHACNTLPSPKGGISGKPLIPLVRQALTEIKAKYPDAELIGGGGITSVEDASVYLRAGASRVAVGSMLFNPFNHKHVEEIANSVARTTEFLVALPG